MKKAYLIIILGISTLFCFAAINNNESRANNTANVIVNVYIHNNYDFGQNISLYIDDDYFPAISGWANANSNVSLGQVLVPAGSHVFEVVGDFGSDNRTVNCQSNGQIVLVGNLGDPMISVDVYADNNGPAQWVDLYIDSDQSPTQSKFANDNSPVWFTNISVTKSFHEFEIQGGDFGSVWNGTDCQHNGQDIYVGQLNQSMIIIHIYVHNSGPSQQVDLTIDGEYPAISSVLANPHSMVWFRDILVPKGYHWFQVSGFDFGYDSTYMVDCQFNGQEIYVGKLKYLPPFCSLGTNPNNGSSPLTVTFTLNGYDYDGTITSWSLDVNNDDVIEYSGGGNLPTSRQYTYLNPGIYTAKFTTIDNDGEAKTAYTIITVITDDKPVASWHLNQEGGNIAYDSSGNNNHGKIYGAQWTEGISGNGLYFNGITDYIEVNDSNTLDITNEITLEAWIKPSIAASSYIISKRNTTIGGSVYTLDIYPGKTRSILQKVGGGSTDYGAQGTSPIIENIWQHIAVTWDGTTVKIYYNGHLEGTNSFIGQIPKSNGLLIIGNYLNQYFKGVIDEIRIYDYAISAEEIQTHALPPKIFIDDDYTSLTPGWNYTHFSNIQDGINNIAINGTIFIAQGAYNENIQVYKSITLTGENKNTTIVDGGDNDTAFSLFANRVTITNFTIQNGGPKELGPGGILIDSDYNVITNNNINSNNIGVSFNYSNNNIISRNIITNNYFEGIYLSFSHNNIIQNNNISDVTLGGEGGNGIYIWACTNNTLLNNTISNNPTSGISIINSRDQVIINNSCQKNDLGAIYLYNSSFNIIDWNNCSRNRFSWCWNTKTSWEGEGITITWQSNNNSIQNNTCTSNFYHGIKISSSTGNIVSNNKCSHNDYDGIFLSNASNTLVAKNHCQNNYNYSGILVIKNSENNTIFNNNVSCNGDTGIDLSFSNQNLIKENLLINNKNAGIHLTNSSNNHIYHNELINNTNNSYDNSINIWDNDYPYGGNYWNDYDEPSEGAYDNNSDGIIDTPYGILGGNNLDRYPLKNPVDQIENEPPSCSLMANRSSGVVPLSVEFLLSGSDGDGSVVSWSLDVDDDGVAEYSGSGSPPSIQQHTYPTAGIYTAKFMVTDDDGAMNSDTQVITVNQAPPQNQAPTCILSANPTSGLVPLTVTFTLSGSDSDGTIATWTLDINNDGASEYSGSGSPPSIQQHTYPTAGIYTAKLMITDDDGATCKKTVPISISSGDNQDPRAKFIYTPMMLIKVYTPIHFMDQSYDNDGIIVNWTWDLGEGTMAYGQKVNHSYTSPGTYIVTLTIKDNQGAQNNYTNILVITVAHFIYTPFTSTEEDATIRFIDNTSDKYGIIVNWTWDFNDGSISYGKDVNHTFENPKTYNVTLTIKNDKGTIYNYTQSIIVKKKENETPGFQLILLLCTFTIALAVLSKKKIKR